MREVLSHCVRSNLNAGKLEREEPRDGRLSAAGESADRNDLRRILTEERTCISSKHVSRKSERGKVIRLVLECGLMTEDETRQLCAFAAQYRIKWLSTGTGFHGYPATVDMVKRLRALAPADVQIKAAGGIRTAADVRDLIEAGATLIGTSSSTDIMQQK